MLHAHGLKSRISASVKVPRPPRPYARRAALLGAALVAALVIGPSNALSGERGRKTRKLYRGHALFAHRVYTCQKHLFPAWQKIRAFEKLALAEQIISRAMRAYGTYCEATNYEWKEGTDDLSLPAGRAKWGLEHLLGVKLPGIISRTTQEEDRNRLLAAAKRLVHTYRSGMVSLGRDHELPEAAFAVLKLRYAGRIDPWNVDKHAQSTYAIEDLLTDWPPVGRKFERFVKIIGTAPMKWDSDVDNYLVPPKSTQDADRKGACYYYEIAGVETGRRYVFVVVDGIIYSVHIEPII